MSQPIIRVENLCKSFSGQPVLRGVNLSVPEHAVTVVIGKSGGGKSVLLKHIIGLMRPDSGDVKIRGDSVYSLDAAGKHNLRGKCSYMFQGGALFDSMSVAANIGLPLRERTRLPKPEIAARVEEMIGRLDLGQVTGKYPSQISGGMQKRVALARALITEPEIVLFDEPTTGLDPGRTAAVLHLIAESRERFGFTAMVVSHDIPKVFRIADRVAMIHEGAISFEGTPEQAMSSDEPALAAFLRGDAAADHDHLAA